MTEYSSDELTEHRRRSEDVEEYEPSIAPGSPTDHGEGEGEGEAQSGDGGVHLPVEEELDLEGVGVHPSAAELAADGMETYEEDVNTQVMNLYRDLLERADDAEVRRQAEDLQ